MKDIERRRSESKDNKDNKDNNDNIEHPGEIQ
jgi:hypothetical protein